MRTRTAPAALLTALALLAAACEGGTTTAATTAGATDETTTTTAAASTTTSTTTTTTAPVPPLVLWADPQVAGALEGYATDFEASTGIPVTVEAMPAARIVPRILDDPARSPDLFVISHRSLPGLLEAGLVSEVALPDPGAFLPAAVAAFTSGGAVYALPYAVDSPALYRNTALAPRQAATHADLVAACDGLDPAVRCLGFPADDVGAHLAVVNAYGGYGFGYGEEGFDPGDVGLDSEGARQAAAFLQAEIEAGRLHPDVGAEAAAARFAAGTEAFLFSRPVADPGIESWDTQGFRPGGADGAAALAEAHGFAVSASTGRPDEALAFLLEVVSTRNAMVDLFLAGFRPPALTAAYRDAAAIDPRITAFAPGDPATLFPAGDEAEVLLGALGNALGVVYAGTYDETVADAPTAFAQAAIAVRDMLSAG